MHLPVEIRTNVRIIRFRELVANNKKKCDKSHRKITTITDTIGKMKIEIKQV